MRLQTGTKLVVTTQCAASQRASAKRRLDRSENTNSQKGMRVLSKKMGSHLLQCPALPCFVIMTLVGMSRGHPSSRRVCVSLLTVSATRPTFHHTDTRPTRMQQAMNTTVIHPAAVQWSALTLSVHVSWSTPKAPAMSLAAACRTSVSAVKARDAREMHSVSTVSFGAAFGRPLMRLMLNKSHSIITRFPSRCFVIKSAGLTVPRIFSILSSMVLLCLPDVLRLHVFDGAAPAAECQPACCCSIRPDSYVFFFQNVLSCHCRQQM